MQKLLIRMGFDACWVDRIINCISTVTFLFLFLVNESVSKVVVPSRGLRQGDLLSPYIFILITEGLSRAINQIKDGRGFTVWYCCLPNGS